ncbi:MAG: hydroxymyristoyl-ACP dehydratase [Gammaproteobacteria bacterium]|nr:hydroxymyristoyl-ACP dehydratase [Gammaproteobacteria bacterium]
MHFLFVDRITLLEPGGKTLGIKHVTPDDDYLIADETGRRCFVPALVGETVGQLAAWNVMVSCDFTKRPVAGIAEVARLHRPVYVGETLLLSSELKRLDDAVVQYVAEARVGQELVFELSALGPLLPMDDFIEQDVVRAQFDALNRPGDITEALLSSKALSEPDIQINPRVASLVQFDNIISHEPGVSIRAEKRITRAAPYFQDHFPKKPVLPMTILLECIMSLGRQFANGAGFNKPYVVQEMRRIKMNDFVSPGDILITDLSIKSHKDDVLVLKCRVSRFEKRVCLLELVMTTRDVIE